MKIQARPCHIRRIAGSGRYYHIMPAPRSRNGHGEHGMQISKRPDRCEGKPHLAYPWCAFGETARPDALKMEVPRVKRYQLRRNLNN
jgi:hypothetical protein